MAKNLRGGFTTGACLAAGARAGAAFWQGRRLAVVPVVPLLSSGLEAWLQLCAGASIGLTVYVIANALLRSRVQADALAYLRGRL